MADEGQEDICRRIAGMTVEGSHWYGSSFDVDLRDGCDLYRLTVEPHGDERVKLSIYKVSPPG